ncbi:hypothetical protein RRG08_034932 [Elysia crispata]|uniref:Uncharacterized protein n=1 Tax=Elysia crispata TaxID=231223 RepID=A0AAE0Y301_9GAST|nr:hypothetical protein RRG08_034932 [Elysia crispata]
MEYRGGEVKQAKILRGLHSAHQATEPRNHRCVDNEVMREPHPTSPSLPGGGEDTNGEPEVGGVHQTSA